MKQVGLYDFPQNEKQGHVLIMKTGTLRINPKKRAKINQKFNYHCFIKGKVK